MSKAPKTGGQLIADVSTELDQSSQIVGPVVMKLFELMGRALDARHDVSIKALGLFSVREDEYGLPHIRFTPSLELKKLIHVRPEMNKYGVVLSKNKTMTAKLTGKCPKCGTDLETKEPPKCPTCGTEPFEEEETNGG